MQKWEYLFVETENYHVLRVNEDEVAKWAKHEEFDFSYISEAEAIWDYLNR